jgi:hypothetical protein
MKKLGAILVSLGLVGGALLWASSPSREPFQRPVPEERSTDLQDETESFTSIDHEKPVIYVTFMSHNEEPNFRQPNYFENNLFERSRASLIELVNILNDYGVKYNLQSDGNFLKAALELDDGSDTDGKNIVKWMYDEGVEIDPHAHETFYNYADVAYLIEQLGVPTTYVVGGFTAGPPEECEVERFHEPITGWEYPDYTWEAEVLWGGATAGHQNEQDLWYSGIWRPESNDNFTAHDPETIPYIGGFRTKWEGLEQLIERYEAGELDPNKIYTVAIMNDQPSYLDEGFFDELKAELDSISEYVDAGVIQWANLSEILEIWETEYGAEPNQLLFNT